MAAPAAQRGGCWHPQLCKSSAFGYFCTTRLEERQCSQARKKSELRNVSRVWPFLTTQARAVATPTARERKCAKGSGVPSDPPRMARLWGCCVPNMIKKCPFLGDLPIAKRYRYNAHTTQPKKTRARRPE